MGLKKIVYSKQSRTDVTDAYVSINGFRSDGTPVLQAKFDRDASDNEIIAVWGFWDNLSIEVEDEESLTEEEALALKEQRDTLALLTEEQKNDFREDISKIVYKHAKIITHKINGVDKNFSKSDDILEEGQTTEII